MNVIDCCSAVVRKHDSIRRLERLGVHEPEPPRTPLAGTPVPLRIGKVQPTDGSGVPGFICEGIGVGGATDSTGVGGWRTWLAAGAPR